MENLLSVKELLKKVYEELKSKHKIKEFKFHKPVERIVKPETYMKYNEAAVIEIRDLKTLIAFGEVEDRDLLHPSSDICCEIAAVRAYNINWNDKQTVKTVLSNWDMLENSLVAAGGNGVLLLSGGKIVRDKISTRISGLENYIQNRIQDEFGGPRSLAKVSLKITFGEDGSPNLLEPKKYPKNWVDTLVHFSEQALKF